MIDWAMKPLTDKPSIYARKAADAIDAPRDPGENRFGRYGDFANKLQAMARGGIAGATEGVGNLLSDATSPLSIISNLAGAGGMNKLLQGANSMSRGVGPTIDILESLPVKQVAGSMDDVDSVLGDMARNLAKIPNRGGGMPSAPPGISPSMMPAEMVGRGGESIYNANRAGKMAQYGNELDDIAQSGSQVAGKMRMSLGGNNLNIPEMMAKLAAARGR